MKRPRPLPRRLLTRSRRTPSVRTVVEVENSTVLRRSADGQTKLVGIVAPPPGTRKTVPRPRKRPS